MKAVIFDLDDTLYPEKEFVWSGFRAVADECAVELGRDPDAIFDRLVEISDDGERRRTFNVFLKSAGLPESLTDRLVHVYRNHHPEISAYPGTQGLLKELSGNYLLGIVSDGDLGVQQRKWAALGLDHFFQAVVFSDELGREHWKPSDRPFHVVLGALGVPPQEAAYVGENSLKDFVGARRAGMFTVRVLEPAGYYTMEEPPTPEHAADTSVVTLADVVDVLKDMRRGDLCERAPRASG